MLSVKTLENLVAQANRCNREELGNGAVAFFVFETRLLFVKDED